LEEFCGDFEQDFLLTLTLRLRHAFAVRFMPILCLVAKNRRRKDTKGPNALWIPARLVAFSIFWWLPKGIVASAAFAQQNPKILLLLRAGYRIPLHSAPRCKANQEKDIYVAFVVLQGSQHARRNSQSRSFRHFFATRQRNGIFAIPERARCNRAG
jgi:hypothetical protein